MFDEDCLDIYKGCIYGIVAPEDNAEKSSWVDYSNNLLDCGKDLIECNGELIREYELLKKEIERETKNSGGYKANKKSKTKKHYKTKKRYKTNKLSKKCSKTKH
jgi:hypothetical protein